MYDHGRTNRHRPPRWGSATLGLANLVVVRRQNSLFSGRMMQGRIEMTTTSLHAHPLSHLIRADASGIASVVSFASRGSSSAECRSKTTRTVSGGARDSQDSEPRRACPPKDDAATNEFRALSLCPPRLPRVHKSPHGALRVLAYTRPEFVFLSTRHTVVHSRRGAPSRSRDAICWIQ